MVQMESGVTFSNWHFKRELVADNYFKTIFSGVMLSTTIFSEKQMGLTNFLINDLMSCAVKNDHNVAYVDLSNKNVPVTAAVLMALDRVLTVGNASGMSFNFLKGIFFQDKNNKQRDLEFYLNSEDSIDLKYFSKNIEAHLKMIEEKILSIMKKKKLLLIFDHVDELSTGEVSEKFLRFFRTLLIEKRDHLKPIYATSDMECWAKIFKDTTSPLFSAGASVHNLPALDKPFLRAAFNHSAIGSQITIDDLFHSFHLMGKRPGIFLGMLAGWGAQRNAGITLYEYVASELEALKASSEVVEPMPELRSLVIER